MWRGITATQLKVHVESSSSYVAFRRRRVVNRVYRRAVPTLGPSHKIKTRSIGSMTGIVRNWLGVTVLALTLVVRRHCAGSRRRRRPPNMLSGQAGRKIVTQARPAEFTATSICCAACSTFSRSAWMIWQPKFRPRASARVSTIIPNGRPSPTTLQSNTRPASTARSSWSDIRLAPMPSCSWANISARRACRWRWLCRSTAPVLSPHRAMSQRVMNLTQRDYAYMRKGSGFRGELSNIDVSNQAGIDHINIDKSARSARDGAQPYPVRARTRRWWSKPEPYRR